MRRTRVIALEPGDMIALPPNQAHSFRVVGDGTMRLLGIHHSPDRIVNYLNRETCAQGAPILDGGIWYAVSCRRGAFGPVTRALPTGGARFRGGCDHVAAAG